MWLWVYRACEQCGKIDRVILATDDQRIFDSAIKYHANVVLTGEHNSGTDRVYSVAVANKLSSTDIVINVQGDEPLITPWHLELLIDSMIESPRTKIATLATPIDYDKALNSNTVKVVCDTSKKAMYFSRLPIPYNAVRYLKHIGIYAYRMEALSMLCSFKQSASEIAEQLEQLRALDNGFDINVCVTTHDTIAVDIPKDIQRVTEGMERNCRGLYQPSLIQLHL
jgi:3-deoxy-manno-octulosonate cytidylyltransferase (CMP-KDO synthetase)